jgi:hypothetical protein
MRMIFYITLTSLQDTPQIDGFERRVEETELLADVVKLAAEVAHDLLLS